MNFDVSLGFVLQAAQFTARRDLLDTVRAALQESSTAPRVGILQSSFRE